VDALVASHQELYCWQTRRTIQLAHGVAWRAVLHWMVSPLIEVRRRSGVQKTVSQLIVDGVLLAPASSDANGSAVLQT
jgi:hypothetical protein